MTKHQIFTAAACFASLGGAALHGQTAEKSNIAFQYFVADDKITTMNLKVDTLGGRTTVGRPLSATEVRHTLQVLGDGTRIDKEETDKYYRDSEGRTRIERSGAKSIAISDPVSGFAAEMSSENKTAHKMMIMKRTGDFSTTPDAGTMEKLRAEDAARGIVTGPNVMIRRPPVAAIEGAPAGAIFSRSETVVLDKEMAEKSRGPVEDLGTQIINGVPAQGTRSTVTIPAGQIGNDRDIRIVSERWYSTDLQMLVRSSNDDPRFGKTTYELTNIVQEAQDPSLFQIPADFNVNGLR